MRYAEFILLMALIAFFNALSLPLVSEPLRTLVDEVLAFLDGDVPEYAPSIVNAEALGLS